RHPPDARPDPPDVPGDRELWPFRPRAVPGQARQRRNLHRVLVGEDRQGRSAAQGGEAEVGSSAPAASQRAALAARFIFWNAVPTPGTAANPKLPVPAQVLRAPQDPPWHGWSSP